MVMCCTLVKMKDEILVIEKVWGIALLRNNLRQVLYCY